MTGSHDERSRFQTQGPTTTDAIATERLARRDPPTASRPPRPHLRTLARRSTRRSGHRAFFVGTPIRGQRLHTVGPICARGDFATPPLGRVERRCCGARTPAATGPERGPCGILPVFARRPPPFCMPTKVVEGSHRRTKPADGRARSVTTEAAPEKPSSGGTEAVSSRAASVALDAERGSFFEPSQ